MANNPNLYNAIIAGAAGANQQRWLTQAVAANYAGFQAAIVAIAGAVDDAISPILGDATSGEAALMQSIVQGVFADRFVQSASQGSYDSIVGPIVALYTELAEALEPAAGTAIVPLTNVYYVDAGSTAIDPDGSIAAPYPTIVEAIQAIEDPDFFATILVTPGSYSGEDINDLSKSIAIVGLALGLAENSPQVVLSNSEMIIGALTFTNVFLSSGNVISANVGLEFDSCRISAGIFTAIDGARVDLTLCDVTGGEWVDCIGNIDQYTSAFMRIFVGGAVANAFIVRGGFGTITGIPIVIPALPDSFDIGYVDVDVTGTELDGITTQSQVLVTPQSDLSPAVFGGGFMINARVSATNTIRVLFKGTLAGGEASFIITRTGTGS